MKNNGLKYSHRMRTSSARTLLVALVPMVMLSGAMGSGCNSSSDASKQLASSTMQIVNEAQEGGVKLTVALDRRVVQVAQPVNLEITAQAPEGVSVQFPEPSDSFGPFQIVDVQEQFDIPLGQDRIWKREYELESLASGTKTIPPLKISFVDRRSGKPVSGAVSSTPIELEIASLLEGQSDPTKFRDIKGVVHVTKEKTATNAWITYGVSAGGIFLLAGVLLLLWHRRHRKSTPAEWALVQLACLEERNLLAGGDTHIFYCCLTDIIRHYIEDRFGYRAPKQTTTEFLSAVQREDLLCEKHQAPLQEFLQVADMVKFACHSPSRDEADAAIDKARKFIHDTANDETASVKEEVAA